jgi:DNA-binding response OmpR family regulator
MRVLLVEDDVHLCVAMKRALEAVHYTVDATGRADEASALARIHVYGVILLDLALTQGDGLEALRDIRNAGTTAPVIVVTAQDEIENRIALLDAGADDYLVKPVDLDELLARVRAQLRRAERRSEDVLSAGDVILDLGGRIAMVNGEAVLLTAKEFQLAALLMRRPGRFFTKEEIDGALYDGDVLVSANAIEAIVSTVRRKLGRTFIVTARGLGYMAPK